MRYWLDSEFIEDGKTIDLISIALVAEDGREYYAVSKEFDLRKVHSWLWENVMPYLPGFDTILTNPHHEAGERAWKTREEIRRDILDFCDPKKYGKPEFWAYYADYDWVAFCQLFGKMIDLPEGFPMYCKDLKQLVDGLGNPRIPIEKANRHDALADARWNKAAFEWLANEFA